MVQFELVKLADTSNPIKCVKLTGTGQLPAASAFESPVISCAECLTARAGESAMEDVPLMGRRLEVDMQTDIYLRCRQACVPPL